MKLFCPFSLHFNPKTLTCDHPELAGCEEDDEAKQIPCWTEIIYHPSQRNCNWFYLCVAGKAERKECSAGLHWNQEALKCDFPEIANCQVSILEFFTNLLLTL